MMGSACLHFQTRAAAGNPRTSSDLGDEQRDMWSFKKSLNKEIYWHASAHLIQPYTPLSKNSYNPQQLKQFENKYKECTTNEIPSQCDEA
jgi:hypothetical protein